MAKEGNGVGFLAGIFMGFWWGFPVAAILAFALGAGFKGFLVFWGLSMLVGGVFYYLLFSYEAAKETAKEMAKEKEEYEREQDEKRNRATELITEAQVLVEALPNKMVVAQKSLDKAEIEFDEGAFSPFWDEVERAVENLARFEYTSHLVVHNAELHQETIANLDSPPPKYNVSIDHCHDPRPIQERLQRIVRQAQKDYQFANIYEQRKTNQILVAGFGSLGDAIYDMGNRIANSIDDLSNVVTVGFSEQNELLGSIASNLDGIRTDALTESNSRRAHEQKELEMLDDIRSRRKPDRIIPDSREGDWEK